MVVTRLVRCFSVSRVVKLAKQSKTQQSYPKVDIDPSGTFKYILIKVFDTEGKREQNSVILRGYSRHEWHNDIFDEVQKKLDPYKCEPLGGGKIVHKPEDKKIRLYGKSTAYGAADHELAATMIRETYPDYTVTVGEEDK